MDIELTRTDSEGPPTRFRKLITDGLGIIDLQGLWIGDDGAFTQALEAFDVTCAKREVVLSDLFDDEEVLVKATAASRLGVPFSIWLHYAEKDALEAKGCDVLECRRIKLDETQPKGFVEESPKRYSKASFMRWFEKNKKTEQTKKFSEADHLDNYFDNLVRSRGLRWGGNIDGILFDHAASRIRGIVEIRCTQAKPIHEYDPAAFYRGTRKKPEGDYNTWKPVLMAAEQLGVPCFLMTFPKDEKVEEFGIAVVEGQDTHKLYYRDGKPPFSNLMKTSEEARRYIERKAVR